MTGSVFIFIYHFLNVNVFDLKAMRTREAMLWELEEKQIHEKHQLSKRHVKDMCFMQRHQMIIRHEKELDQVKR